VELVWERLREHNSSAIWRQMRRKWLKQGIDTALQDGETNGLAPPGQFERDVA
jgi:hypothetical protein